MFQDPVDCLLQSAGNCTGFFVIAKPTIAMHASPRANRSALRQPSRKHGLVVAGCFRADRMELIDIGGLSS
ncbi:hypothetical protein V474_23135 [Novosphingobium barchaimii LL02]|uniref:Uncharacterized protein n=1 Tax=Novosphingobium barchaimii LL02 TaxID=1114963 RepID=A0A0J8AFH2_9SPHN|nr:hypothetical protein V474_23135 [Novosphingobium barchaimii LL02]